jgi:hypothetical protein
MDCWRIISWGLAPFTGHGNSTALVFSEILHPVLKDVAPPLREAMDKAQPHKPPLGSDAGIPLHY